MPLTMKRCAAPHTVEYNPSIESQVAVTSLRLEPQGHAAIAKVLYQQAIANVLYRGTSLIRNTRPPRINKGPQA